jgi:D-Tyr-tRNAtyr deacylase
VDDEIVSQIGRGLLLFVGFSKSDVASDAESVYVFPNVCRSHSEGRNTRDMMDRAYGVFGVKSCDEKSSYLSL